MIQKSSHNRQVIFAFLSLLLHFFLHTNLSAKEAQTDRRFLWKIQSNMATVYLLGSIHFANDTIYPLHPEIEAAFNSSETLVLEVNPLNIDNAALRSLIQKRGYYSGNDSLIHHLDSTTLGLVERYTRSNGINQTEIYKMKPGMLAIKLTSQKLISLGYLPQHGMDLYFAQKARKRNMKIEELETIRAQMLHMFSMPDENNFLRYTIAELENTSEIIKPTIEAWQAGNASGLYDLLIGPYINNKKYYPYLRKIYFNRNLKMAIKIKKMLKKNGTWFVIVGAAHIPGPNGILDLLERKGLPAQQVGTTTVTQTN